MSSASYVARLDRPLTAAEREYADWKADANGRVGIVQRHGVLCRFSGTEVSMSDFKLLEQDPQFRERIAERKRSIHAKRERARGKLADSMEPGAKLLNKAITTLNKKGELGMEEIRAVPALVEPLVKRIWPLNDQETAAAKVTITLTTQRLAGLEAAPIDVEVEELPVPQDDVPTDA